jgi:hypothetical protein
MTDGRPDTAQPGLGPSPTQEQAVAEGLMPLPSGVFLGLGVLSTMGGLVGGLSAFGASSTVGAGVCYSAALGFGLVSLRLRPRTAYNETRSALAILGAVNGHESSPLMATRIPHP